MQVTVQPLSEIDYLLCNDANKKHLMASIKNYENKENLTTVSLENLENVKTKE